MTQKCPLDMNTGSLAREKGPLFEKVAQKPAHLGIGFLLVFSVSKSWVMVDTGPASPAGEFPIILEYPPILRMGLSFVKYISMAQMN